MSGKFMRVKKVTIPMLTLILMTTQLMGCASVTQEQASSMVSDMPLVQVEVSEPENSATDNTSGNTSTVVEQEEKVEPLKWVPLSVLSSYSAIRSATKEALGIQAFEGSIFIDLEGHKELNNTLFNALCNEEFAKTQLSDDKITSQILEAVDKTFTDIEESDKSAAFFNSFWSLLPEEDNNDTTEFKGSKALTKAQAMTLLTRATTQVEKDNQPKVDEAFEKAVGDTPYTDYAAYVNEKAYLNTKDGTLNDKNFTKNMTRAEYIYLCLNKVFTADELNKVDISKVALKDCKAGTDTDLEKAISNPNNGLPEKLFKVLQQANALGIIDSETRWDESITKTEAIDIFVETVQAYNKQNGYAVKQEKPKEDVDLTAKAKASYARLKDKVTLDESAYAKEYVRLAEQGFEETEIEKMILAEFGKRETPVIEEKPQPQWTEQSITQTTYYVNSDYVNSREKAIQGSTIVKQYRLNDVVTVIATTNTGYMKLQDGSFIHVDYLSKNKIEEVQKPSNTNTGSTNTGSTNTGTTTTVKPIPYTGKLKEPEEGVTKLSEETIVTVMNRQMPVYKVQTETGVYWYLPAGGAYFPTKEDAIKSTNEVPSWKVLPSKYKEGDITGIELH